MAKTNLITKYPKAKAFSQHGMFFKAETGNNNLVGDCIFCESKNHFYLNHVNRKWDCKKCHRSGGFFKFLEEVSEMAHVKLAGASLIKLSEDRGLKKSTLKRWRVGYNEWNGYYTIPVYNADGKGLSDLRLYKIGKPTRSSLGGQAGLCRLKTDSWAKSGGDVWIFEGEWDAMAGEEMFYANSKDTVCQGTPGANTFKHEWTGHYKNKIVTVVYDNDKAGDEGALKVYNLIGRIARKIKFVHWEEKRPKGFDFRDYYVKKNKSNAGKTLRRIQKLFNPKPHGYEESVQNGTVTDDDLLDRFDGGGLSSNLAFERYKKWLHLPNDDVLNVLFGSVIANRLPGDPIWLFLIAPAGGTKTELLMSLSDAPGIHTTTSLTPHSLVSGFSGRAMGDPSLIPKLDGKVLIIKDFTTILNMPYMARDEIFGILRDAYDGKTEKQFGNGVVRSYDSKFGLLGGVTPAIDMLSESHAALGERFLKYRVRISNEVNRAKSYVQRAVGNVARENNMRSELNEIGELVLNKEFETIPERSPEIVDKIIGLAQWTAVMRGSVIRERYTGEVNYKPTAELGTRLAKQLLKLGMGIAMYRGVPEVNNDIYRLVSTVAKDTVPARTEEIFRKMYIKGRMRTWTTGDIAEVTGMPNGTCNRVLEDLHMLKVVDRQKADGLRGRNWQITKGMIKLMRPLNLYKARG